MIDITTLTKGVDEGRPVVYTASGGEKTEVGTISSWNDRVVFVAYLAQLKPMPSIRWNAPREATDPADLEFMCK